MLLRARAPAKVNLTLHILGRRADGFHELDSLVAFAGCAADALTLDTGAEPGIEVSGPFAGAAGEGGDNLVQKAAREAAGRIEGLRLGRFSLVKRIPVAAGLGGGSADAGAALRLIAEANGLAIDDPRLVEAAAAVGSDVPACLASRAARMTGRGEGIAFLDSFAPVPAVLANPMKALSTAEVFRALGLRPGEMIESGAALLHASRDQVGCFRLDPSLLTKSAAADLERGGWPWPQGQGREGAWGVEQDPDVEPLPARSPPDPADAGPPSPFKGEGLAVALDVIRAGRNDLEPPARALLPEIGLGLDALLAAEGCRLARMSGSGATVFGLFADQRTARRAARELRNALPGWWIRPTLLR